jgi:hypothetical protein
MSSAYNNPSPASLPTSAQPALHVDNITAHPGSTWAGAGVAVYALGNAMVQQGMPTTTGGWVSLLLPVLMGGLAALGK